MMFFSEVRLNAGATCRAWAVEQGCFSAAEWEKFISSMPDLRAVWEGARLRISEILSVDGIDPLGFARKLLIHESAAPLSRAALREVGFVHLEAASGIHLYALWRAYEYALARLSSAFGISIAWTRFLRTFPPLGIWLMVFALTGFRPGLLRPLALVVARWISERFGFRWARAAPILFALGFDALLAFYFSFGSERSFTEWAPGELHYAAAWWGGILGYEWAKRRGFGAFRAHIALSVASWISVLPLDLAAGYFAPATPLLSLLTVEFLARGGYLLLFGVALGAGFSDSGEFRVGLQWTVALLSRGLAVVMEFLAESGFIRRVPEGYEGVFALGLIVLLVGFGAQIATNRRVESKPVC